MKYMKFCVLLAVIILSGCATSAISDATSDKEAKKFLPPEGGANVYVARNQDKLAPMFPFKVSLDGKEIGTIPAGTYHLVAVKPGKHTLFVTSMVNQSKIDFESKAGKNYFYEVTAASSGSDVKAGLGVVIFEEMGKLMVRQLKQVDNK